MTIQNKLTLVTGASRGIGQAIALALGEQGATVIGTATTSAGAAAITQTLKKHHMQGEGMVLDVTQTPSIDDTFSKILDTYGAAPLILVNNAGITRDNLMLRMQEAEWNAIINTNLNSVYRVTKHCLKGMLKARWGRIINVSSVIACTGNPGQANYAAAKAGMLGYTKSLAQELATRNITVNAVAPGFIATDMTHDLSVQHKEMILQQIPMQKMGDAKDIASAVAFLASEGAAYITGQTLHVNGGMYMV